MPPTVQKYRAAPGKEGAVLPQVAGVAVADATVTYDKIYSYVVPASLEGHIFVGSMVLAPFGRGRGAPRIGVVMQLDVQDAPAPRLKTLYDAAPEEEALNGELLALVEYLKEATFCTWFEAVRAVLPRGAQYKAALSGGGYRLRRQLAHTTQTVYELAPGEPPPENAQSPPAAKPGAAPSEKQRRVLEYLRGGPRSKADIMAGCGVSAVVAETLCKQGRLQKTQRPQSASADAEYTRYPGALPAAVYTLSPAQRQVADGLMALCGTAAQNGKAPPPALLYGVTGSGKTPVFIHLIGAVLAQGKGALVLVPEIGLTHQMVGALRAAFGRRVAIQHSGLSPSQRLAQWRAIKRGDTPVVVGTRSAVFAPLERLGLVVIDEEQERSYQSESAPRYNAIEVAQRRAARHGALLLLASATPSVASYYAARQGAYKLFCLKERYGNMPLPEVEMVDMAAEWFSGNTGAVSAALAAQMRQTIAAKGQVILLLNRRGYHRVAICRGCKKSVKCGSCSVPMVYHRDGALSAPAGFLLCHHCGQARRPAPDVCPDCGAQLRYAGAGTQRLEEELAEALPGARLLRMDLDTTARKGSHAAMLHRFAKGEYDVLLGTQMVAKGLDFERVKLVGVIGVDALMLSQSYRAFEHVFSLVTQVVGRSGRAGRGADNTPGKALIQTVDPQNPILALAAQQNYEAFYAQEIAFRKLALYPPLCALCQVGFASKQEENALAAARRFAALLAERAKAAPHIPLRVLGPSPMAVAQLAGSYRWRLTLKCRNDAAFRGLAWAAASDYNKEGWPRKASMWLDFNAE